MRDTDLDKKLSALVEEIVMRILTRRFLIVITGGTIGLDAAMDELEKTLIQQKVSADLLFSKAASKIHDVKTIKDKLNADEVFIEGKDRIDNIKNYTGMIFAVLTRNTAAKAANLILDAYVVEIMIDALMLGIPVIASKDAADIKSSGWQDLGYSCNNKSLVKSFDENISRLQNFGVHICSSNKISETIESVIIGASLKSKKTVATSGKASVTVLDKNPVTRKDIIPYLDTDTEIYIPSNVLITPLAQDIISDFNLKIVRD